MEAFAVEPSHEAALPFIAWSRIWSPLAPTAWREEAWQVLSLPGRFMDCESAFLSAFVVGLPSPTVPLQLHAALGRDGGTAREDWMRVIQHLELRWNEQTLPPDHLGVACETRDEVDRHRASLGDGVRHAGRAIVLTSSGTRVMPGDHRSPSPVRSWLRPSCGSNCRNRHDGDTAREDREPECGPC